MIQSDFDIEKYDYHLPEDRIARFPAEPRDASKLLIYRHGALAHTSFAQLGEVLTAGDLLVFNDTKVIPARLQFVKETGGQIEIFCLEPVAGSAQDAMTSTGKSIWKCFVGGARKWKAGTTLSIDCGNGTTFYANRLSSVSDYHIVEFFWKPDHLTFSEVLHLAGSVPLPPYFKRQADDADMERYQTVFARYEGSVAAPTAALHFTTALIDRLTAQGVVSGYVTLNVGAGTFKPVSSKNIREHEMHAETFSVDVAFIEKLRNAGNHRIVVVGTTSMRTLESLYWLGIKLMVDKSARDNNDLHLGQWEAYANDNNIPVADALNTVIEYCNRKGLNRFTAQTSIMIAPGYKFRLCNGLITNFHLPKSTLIVLVSAFVGQDWKKIYDYALNHDFNFLSYGDSSVLIP